MKRLKLLIVIFCLALSIPLAYFVLRTYMSLEQEEAAELRYFADTLFNEMEEALALLVRKEEARAIDEYNYNFTPHDQAPGAASVIQSPLSRIPDEHYVLGYFQNNPDGSFQTPLAESRQTASKELTDVVTQLENVNKSFNKKRTTSLDIYETQPVKTLEEFKNEKAEGFAGKYLNLSRSKKQKVHLGQEKKRVEEITVTQAMKVAQQDQNKILGKSGQASGQAEPEKEKSSSFAFKGDSSVRSVWGKKEIIKAEYEADRVKDEPGPSLSPHTEKLQVEVDPMQSVFIDDARIFIFRRIVIHNQIYRQGFVIMAEDFLRYLAETHFANQPMSRFARLQIRVMDGAQENAVVRAGAMAKDPVFSLNRIFPRPFSFLQSTLSCEEIPRSAGRKTLNIMMSVLAGIILMGFFAIYRSAQAVVDLSERRSNFVSSVTHELKTPLTNIRMYVEMLEQGIARTFEREQEYFRILRSESARLSRLINNVLEFSKMEKKKFHADMQEGTFEEVIQEVRNVMQEKLRQEGFTLNVDTEKIRPFTYDREGMVQVLTNLIENSMKFGKTCPRREITLRVLPSGNQMKISVSDTGPGIPRHALKKVFDDFYRAESSLTQATRGTGIGLAFVKKFVRITGGSVIAANNGGSGCTITISLPL